MRKAPVTFSISLEMGYVKGTQRAWYWYEVVLSGTQWYSVVLSDT